MKSSIASFIAAALVGVSVPSYASPRVDFDNGGGSSVHDIVGRARQAARDEKAPEPEGKALAAQNDEVERSIVVFDKSAAADSRIQSIEALGGSVTKDLWLINAVAVVAPKARMKRFSLKMAQTPGVLRIERDFVQNWLVSAAPAAALPAVNPALTRPAPQGDVHAKALPWGIDRVNAKSAWSVTKGGGVKVAVVDTGIDFDHPDLKVTGGYNATDPTKSFKDDNGHGTHVSGTIAGQGKGDVFGIAPEVSLYGVKVLDANGSGTFADVIAGIQWTAQNHMDVANFSLGASQGTQALADAVKAATDAGVTICAAAGNSGGAVGYPAAYPQTIAVAASDSSDKVADFSSRGPEVNLIAPGVDVYSTYMGGGYETLSGTSMATPHITGLAALAVSRGAHGAEAVRAALKKAAKKFPGVPDEQQGAGMVDAGALVRE